MFNPIATNGPKYLEPLLAHSGAPPDSEGSKQPAYLGLHIRLTPRNLRCLSLPYRPYAEKPTQEAPYEPYKGI